LYDIAHGSVEESRYDLISPGDLTYDDVSQLRLLLEEVSKLPGGLLAGHSGF